MALPGEPILRIRRAGDGGRVIVPMPAGCGGFVLRSSAGGHVAADLVAHLQTSSITDRFTPIVPYDAMDTTASGRLRSGRHSVDVRLGSRPNAPFGDIPSRDGTAVVSLTVWGSSSPGSIRLASGGAIVRFQSKEVVTTTAFIPYMQQVAALRVDTPVNVRMTVVGWVGRSTTGGLLHVESPQVVLDTSRGTPPAANARTEIDLTARAGVPRTASAVMVDLGLAGAGTSGRLTAGPADVSPDGPPVAVSVRSGGGATASSVAHVSNGTLTLVADVRAHRTASVWGWFAAPEPLVDAVALPTVDQTEPDGAVTAVDLSSDGAVVALASDATRLVASEDSPQLDVYLWNRTTGVVARMSSAADGGEADAPSTLVGVNRTGTEVAFLSAATDLMPAATPAETALYIRTTTTGELRRIAFTGSPPTTLLADDAVDTFATPSGAVYDIGPEDTVVSPVWRAPPGVRKLVLAADGEHVFYALDVARRLATWRSNTRVKTNALAFALDRDGTTYANTLGAGEISGEGGVGRCYGTVSVDDPTLIALSDDGRVELISGCEGRRKVGFLLFGPGRRVRNIDGGLNGLTRNGAVMSMALSGDGRVVAWVSSDTNVSEWPATSGWLYVFDTTG